MLIKKAINEKSLKVIFAGFISYYFGLIILQYNFKAGALLGLAVFVILFFTKVEYVFYLLLASRTFIDIFYDVETAGSLRISHFIGGLISLLFIYYSVVISRHNFFHILNLGINKIYVSFLLLSIPTIFFTESLTNGFGYWFRLFQGFLFLNMTILVVTSVGNELYKKRINIICWSIILAIVFPYILYLKNYIQGVYIVGSGEIIRYGVFGVHYNVFPYLLFIILPFCIFLYSVTNRNSKKIFWLFFISIIIFTIYTTYTRNIWVGLAILLIAWNVFRKNFKITLSVISIIVLMIIFNPTVQERLQDIYIFLTSEDFFSIDPKLFSNRVRAWQENIRYFITHSTLIEKFFGNGYDVPSKVLALYGRAVLMEHNTYLFLLMTTGIFGLSAYLLYVIKLFQESFKLLRRTKEVYLRNLARVFIPLLLAYVSISMMTQMLRFISVQYYFSVFAGLVIAANILEKNRNKDKERNGVIN